MPNKTTIFWFRQDLRLSDNPGFYHAANQGHVMPIYIHDEIEGDDYKIGAASKWWLHSSLTALNESLDYKLNFYKGNIQEVLLEIINKNAIDAVYWNRCYEPWRIEADSEIKTILKAKNIECKSFKASLLLEPWQILKEDGTPYKVFTAFYQKGYLQNQFFYKPLPKPEKINLLNVQSNKTTLADLCLLPKINWYQKMEKHWVVGENEAQEKLQSFLKDGFLDYKEGRDYPAKENVSRLSPHLHFGEISPNQIWFAVYAMKIRGEVSETNADCFLKELVWREFSYNLLYHFPNLPYKNLQDKFDNFPWNNNQHYLDAWKKGQTGYPIIDAGMRELWQTGYMHNRIRMIVGSFLVKNLLLHWHHGERWFWDCLVDADLANNSASWQWVAGCGADAAPYFRIFNPITQGEKFDQEGAYTKRFVPELANMPIQYLFKPWKAPEHILKKADVVLGETYPQPIVPLEISRQNALQAFASLKNLTLIK